MVEDGLVLLEVHIMTRKIARFSKIGRCVYVSLQMSILLYRFPQKQKE